MTEFPLVEGEYQMTRAWSIALPGAFQRRFEDNSLVLWRPGVTARINVWGNDNEEPPHVRLGYVQKDRSEDAFDVVTESHGHMLRYAYRLHEPSDDRRHASFCCFAFGASGHVQMAVYFDDEADLVVAQSLWRGLREAQ